MKPAPRTFVVLFGAALAGTSIAGCGARAEARDRLASTTLTVAGGARAGSVVFEGKGERVTNVRVDVDLPGEAPRLGSFHGLHVHANNDPANGGGCEADPRKPPKTWFVSADGHLKVGNETHGAHLGDLPSLLVLRDGKGRTEFATDRLRLQDVVGRAVILHVGADNFGNVPTGRAEDQYRANSAEARAKTAATGNAGDRLACGVVRRS